MAKLSKRAQDQPLQLCQVLLEELRHLRPHDAGLRASGFTGPRCLADLFKLVHSWSAGKREEGQAASEEDAKGEAKEAAETTGAGTRPLTALCFSGGGIRSATFNLGVLQGLAKAGLLGDFDYLSSVSGGGYISSWLARWIHFEGHEEVRRRLTACAPLDPEKPEPQQVTYLRRYSNYLTPRLGALSADTWTLIAIGVRNILLNWLVLVPLLTAPVLVPLLAVARWPAIPHGAWIWLIVAAYLLEGVGLYFVDRFRDTGMGAQPERATPAPADGSAAVADGAVAPADGAAEAAAKPAHAPPFLRLGLLPRLAALPPLLVGFYLCLDLPGPRGTGPGGPSWSCLLLPGLIWAVGLPLVALWAAGLPSRRRDPAGLWWDSGALLVAGCLEAALLAKVFSAWGPALAASPHPLYAILGPGLVIGPVLLGRTLFVALSSIAEHFRTQDLGDSDREWWARWSGWALISGVVWIVGSALVLLAPSLLASVKAQVTAAISAGGLGALAALLGKSASTPAKEEAGGAPAGNAGGGRMTAMVLSLAAPLFVVLAVLSLSTGAQHVLARLPGEQAWPDTCADHQVQGGGGGSASTWCWIDPYRGGGGTELAAIAALLLLGFTAGYPVNINRFSMQAGYRNRLIRAYLGASNGKRRPNLFTGFDPKDNLPLHELGRNRPFPLINITLNLVRGENLAWQERKAESFTASPLHCGSAQLGYRPTRSYGGHDGLTLGTAVATSGAAANPNMGFNSSPAITFIMTLFTVRLGAWLGNPRTSGRYAPYKRSGPRFSAVQLLAEAFGWTDERHPYVSLSDGGHFEDLGLYEMVRRRCRYILVCDAGADPGYGFKDLGNAIRKIRIDFGIPIVFEDRVYILPKRSSGQAASDAARYCAVADILYDKVDEGGVKGKLIYIKPSIVQQPLPATPFDVTNYARFSRDFPHETTADQWFSETQFESYRALGEDAVSAIALRGPCAGFPELLLRVEKYLERTARSGEARQVDGGGGVAVAGQEPPAPGEPPAP
jgi:Patatin-like phospholipase